MVFVARGWFADDYRIQRSPVKGSAPVEIVCGERERATLGLRSGATVPKQGNEDPPSTTTKHLVCLKSQRWFITSDNIFGHSDCRDFAASGASSRSFPPQSSVLEQAFTQIFSGLLI